MMQWRMMMIKKKKKKKRKLEKCLAYFCLVGRRLAQDEKIKILYLLQCKSQPTCSSFLAQTVNHQATSPLAAAVLLEKKNNFENP